MKWMAIILFIISHNAFAQDSLNNDERIADSFPVYEESKPTRWSVAGYLKDMQWIRWDEQFLHAQATNLVHNRINARWKPSNFITVKLELRNRLYWGDDVSNIPFFKKQVRNQYEAKDLSIDWAPRKNVLFNSNIERAYLELRKTKWNLSVGRQRINWGMNNTWNPNDIFNTYNFLDFDYEERPGSDAIRFQWLTDSISNIELAIAATNKDPIAAIKYTTNLKNYDLQLMAGVYNGLFTAGLGWAGSISNAGFKGEIQYYKRNTDTVSALVASIEADYIFENGWYLSMAGLYQDQGLNESINDFTQLSFTASPMQLMPARWNILINGSKPFTPLFSGSMNLVYSPGINMLIIFPSLSYNLTPNIDLNLVWQSLFLERDKFKGLSHTGFLRVKWSF